MKKEKIVHRIDNVEALYPKMDQPYVFNKKGGPNGKGGSDPCDAHTSGADYSTSFKMTGAQAKELLTAMHKAYKVRQEDSWPEFKNPFAPDTENPKLFVGKARIDASWERPPVHIDAKKNDLGKGFKVTKGSTISLQVEMHPWYNERTGNGVALRLEAVQVVKLAERAVSNVFDVVEGFAKEDDDSSEDDLESVFDVVTEEEEEEEVVVEPKVKVSKKKKDAPKDDVDLASLLDGFDD